MSLGGEISDLLILLAIVCVPLAVGAVYIPVGRAIADRIRGARRDAATEDMLLRALWEIERRIASLERTVEAQPYAVSLLAHQQPLMNLSVSSPAPIGPSTAPESITPH